MVRLLILALISILASCNSQKSGDVEINTSGVYTPVSITYANKELGLFYDFGEYLIGSGPITYNITITNNSLFPLTELTMALDTFESFGFGFEKTDDGKNKFPGKTGTCTATLLPAHSCIVALQFETNISKFYEQPITFSYLNYIEAASKTITLKVLAGNPASLVFENEVTNYYFGDLIGMAQVPVLERDIVQEYSQVLKVTNAGDLRARNLTNSNIILSQTCNSAETKTCPVGQNTAYRITHNCPTELKQGEFCEVIVYFKPLNQALTAEMKNVRYDSILKLNYKTSSQGAVATLNAYVTTNSVNIEARFDTSIESQIFENTIVVGNRDIRAFRVNNRGYRSGFMRKLVFKDLMGVHVASCVANPLTVPWLECYDAMVTNVKTLADFPFKIKDKNSCLESPFDNGKVIPVDQGCPFDIQFQPSTTYQAPRLFDLEVFAEYDSMWKGVSTIDNNQLHTLTAQSMNAAKIIPVSINHAGSIIPIETAISDTLVVFNAGRMGLMSQTNYRRRPILVTFKNTGGVAATAIVAKDGRNNIIPQKELNPAGVTIGMQNPKYFINSLISTSNCFEIQPNQSCTVQLSFAPVTFYDWNTNANNMFDVTFPAPGPYLDSYKQFIMAYQDGTTYSDSNTNTTLVDSGLNQGESRLKVDLVEKGQLDDYAQAFGMGQQTQGTSYKREMKFSNIGTKDIPYLHYVGTKKLKTLTEGVNVTPTDPAKLDANTLDCSTIFDFNYTPGDTLAMINARSNQWDPFPVGFDCILTLTWFPAKRGLVSSDVFSNVSVLKENSRNTYVGTNSTMFGWDFDMAFYADVDFILDAYDGDLTDPTAVGPYASQFGKYLQGKSVLGTSVYTQPAKLVPYSPRPMASSIIYRPGWTRPSVSDEAGVNFITGSAVPNAWFFSDFTEQTTAFAGFDADFFKGILTKSFFPNAMVLPPVSNYEFVYYMGTVPSGTTLNGSMTLANSGRASANIKTATLTTIQSPSSTPNHFTTSITGATFPILVSALASAVGSSVTGLNTSFAFNGTDEGTYAAELLINYNDGGSDSYGPYMLPIPTIDPRVKRVVQRKILVVAEVSNAVPTLKLDVQDYNVATDDLTPAVESLGAITTTPMSYFEGTTPVLNFTSIKIPTPARKDSFLKRRFIFYNTSGTTPIQDIKLFIRPGSSTVLKDLLQSPTTYYVCMTGTQTNATLASVNGGGVAQPMCTGTCGSTAFNLAPGGSCYIEIRYQPSGTASAKSVTLTALHKVGTDRYVHRNLDMTFQPQDPASVAITNRSPQVIRTSLGTFTSFNIDYGSPNQTTNPMVFTYNAATTGGWNKMLQLNNPSTTKASFLKSYQTYYKTFIDPAITDSALKMQEPVYPGDYTMNVGGVLYTKIWQTNYPSSINPRIQVWANRFCLVGDGTGVWFQRGFTGLTCQMIPVLFADINYIKRTLDVNLASDMDPNYLRLQFYSANRASTGTVTFHFTGSLKPDAALAPSPNGINFYQNVEATSVSSGQVIFKWVEMAPSTPALGPIVGYRIYYAPTSSPLNTVFPIPSTTYVDTPVNGTGLYQLTHSSLGANKFMYYRIFPIRQNSAYTFTPNPFGLTSGKFLSDPNVPVLPVVVPNANFVYHHAGRYLIEKGVFNANLLTHPQAKTACAGRPKLSVIQGPSFVQLAYTMITQPTWNIILSRPDASNYNLTDYPLWLDLSTVNIHTKLLAYPAYNPSADIAYLNSDKIFYIKKTGCGTNCSGNTAVANAFGLPNYTSYIEPAINFAGSRCYIQVP